MSESKFTGFSDKGSDYLKDLAYRSGVKVGDSYSKVVPILRELKIMGLAGFRSTKATGGRIGYQDGSKPMSASADTMEDKEEIVNAIASQPDSESRIGAAITLILQIGDKAVPLLQRALEPAEFEEVIARLEEIGDEEDNLDEGIGSLADAPVDEIESQLARGAPEQGVGSLAMAANGGRIGYAQGTDEEGVIDPDFDIGGQDELFREIEAQGGLRTASMGDTLIGALEDSHWMELDSWLGKYGNLLGEEDYYKFRTLGPFSEKRKGQPITQVA